MANIQNNNYNLPAENFFGDSASNYTLIVRSQRQIEDLKEAIDSPFVREIRIKDDFPTPTNGIIQLEDNVTYLLVTDIDLEGDRIQCGQNNVITGWSSENCSLTSTGLTDPLITSTTTIVIKFITFKDVQTCFDIQGTGLTALDWIGVNIINVENIGDFNNFSNLVLTSCAFFNSLNMRFLGSFDSFVMDTCLMLANGSTGALIQTLSSTVCNRRIRIQNSVINTIGLSDGLSIDPLMTIGDERFILDKVNFGNFGTGVPLKGLDYSSNKASFTGCSGITNSAKFAHYYAQNNTLVTTIQSVDTPVKANIVTIGNTISQKFNFTDNRATYVGAGTQTFKVLSTCSITANSNNDQISIYVAKNGAIDPVSKITITSDSRNRVQNAVNCLPLQLSNGDYIEIWVENNTDSSNIVMTSLNVIVELLTIS